VVADGHRATRRCGVVLSGFAVEERIVTVGDGRVDLRVQVAGTGPPLVFLHPAAGLAWDPFLEALSQEWTIYALQVPGTALGDTQSIHKVSDLWDLVLLYEEAIRSLGLGRPPVIGGSFGGMLAAELAAVFPHLLGRLVLLAPIGLWRDDIPVANWVATPEDALPALLFLHPESQAAQAALAMPADPEEMIGAIAGFVWALGCTAKFVWPLPEKGLSKRLHRVNIPTLVLWGREDRLVSSAYAEEFGRRITGSLVEILDDCGHIPQVEKADETLALVRTFLANY
jgi:pimeloyl-ACP methyl ester carboxylesterase